MIATTVMTRPMCSAISSMWVWALLALFTVAAAAATAPEDEANDQDPADEALIVDGQAVQARVRWRRVVVNAESDFEAAGVADFDGDGDPDIICGDTWYKGGHWVPRSVCEIEAKGGYRVDFANVPLDVDGDGNVDVVSCNWHERSVLWRRNPGAEGGAWQEHVVDRPGNCETAIAVDVDGDGQLDFLPDVAQQTVWYRIENGELVAHTISPDIGGHGIGIGDVNGDGRADVLKSSGWFEAPENRLEGEWRFHPEWNLGAAGIGIIVHDFNGDGLSDIFWGLGHDYGIFWLEQSINASLTRQWIHHEVDTEWSQAHALRLADLDRDGNFEVVTGKRLFGHNGHDPGAMEPLVIWVYSFDRTRNTFVRQSVTGDAPGGVGLAPCIADLDGDGDPDIVAPGKDGLQIYLQESD